MDNYTFSNKRIAKNTLYMYFRMAVIMLVQLYTSRVVLANLGVDNYGIYNVVGSLIVAFTFIKGPLSSATQRFLNHEMGLKSGGKPNLIFNISLYVHAAIALLLIVILELVGQWFVTHEMQIPTGREAATLFAFQICLASLFLNFVRTPYDALIISNEQLSFYAILGLLESVLKLLNAFSLSFFKVDKLELYAINHLTIDIIITAIFYIYTRKNLPTYRFKGLWDKRVFHSLLQFTGWGLFGSFSSMTAQQGVNILLNLFCGVGVNAAMGLAQHVNTSINGLVSNFQAAFRPQVMKCYAAEEWGTMNRLILTTSKFSFLLIFLIAFPFCINCDFILDLWLKHPPQYAANFCILFMGYTLLSAFGGPFWMTIYATGSIRNYQLLYSAIYFLNILFSYTLLHFGQPPHFVLMVRVFLEMVILMIRIIFVKKAVNFSASEYIQTVLMPCFTVTFITCIIQIPIFFFSCSGWTRLGLSLAAFLPIYPLLVFLFCFSQSERMRIREKLSELHLRRTI